MRFRERWRKKLQIATDSPSPFLTLDTSAILEKYKTQTLKMLAVLGLAFLVALAIAIHFDFDNDQLAVKRVAPAAIVIALGCYFLWRDGGSKRAGPISVYGFAAVLILNRALSTPSAATVFLNSPPLCILAILILGFRTGTAFTVALFSILISVYLISLNFGALPIVFVREPNIAYFSGPVFTLFLVIQVGRLLRALAAEGMLSNQLLSQYVESHRHLFSVMTHDLANVLFVGTLSWESKAQPRFVQSIEEMNELAQALKQIHEGVAEQSPVRNRVALTDVIRTAQFVFAVHLKSKGLKLDVDYGNAEHAFLWTSSPILTHVILNNVVSNAIKFSPPEAVIRVSAAASRDRIVIEIADDGEGISEDASQAIHDGQQVNSQPGTRGELGTGFGLKNACEMARRLDIQLELKKAGVRGTVAKLIIPAAT